MRWRLGLALGLGLGCGGPSPSATVRALDEAARQGDAEAALQLLGPQTRARLGADARRAAEQAGRRQLAPSELLAAGWTPPRFDLDDAREIERSGDRAVVEVRGRHGERERVDLVREAGAWKVELP